MADKRSRLSQSIRYGASRDPPRFLSRMALTDCTLGWHSRIALSDGTRWWRSRMALATSECPETHQDWTVPTADADYAEHRDSHWSDESIDIPRRSLVVKSNDSRLLSVEIRPGRANIPKTRARLNRSDGRRDGTGRDQRRLRRDSHWSPYRTNRLIYRNDRSS